MLNISKLWVTDKVETVTGFAGTITSIVNNSITIKLENGEIVSYPSQSNGDILEISYPLSERERYSKQAVKAVFTEAERMMKDDESKSKAVPLPPWRQNKEAVAVDEE